MTETTGIPFDDPHDPTSLWAWSNDIEVAAQPRPLRRVTAKQLRDRAMRGQGRDPIPSGPA